MKNPSRRARKIGTVIATPIAILAAAAMVWQSSYAAFSGTTRNSGNSWSTGSVALTDDDSGTARFQATGMVPGATETKCIAVTAHTTVPGVVKSYVVNPVFSSANLQDHIMISSRHGTGGGFGSCDGFVSAGETEPPEASITAISASHDYATGSGTWAVPAGTTTRTYEVTWRFDTTGMTQAQLDGLQGTQTGFDLQWELQSD
jgi:hypothetical protein